ncbi:hypothetical protein DNTS_009928 [Danionella cerebrum]|uniref:Uncharacterized protein n=1 Tax=Danionella cerebrum TaxID=2873325 RepID=A0A553RL98_9TELE|nr:hypothetical protein DNTS_009928 [Danionella translucida]
MMMDVTRPLLCSSSSTVSQQFPELNKTHLSRGQRVRDWISLTEGNSGVTETHLAGAPPLSPTWHRSRSPLDVAAVEPHAAPAAPAPSCALLTGPEPPRCCLQDGFWFRPWEECTGRKYGVRTDSVSKRVPVLSALLLVHQGDPGLRPSDGGWKTPR